MNGYLVRRLSVLRVSDDLRLAMGNHSVAWNPEYGFGDLKPP